ncbi:MAG: phenylalanine--tRNA ligase subunit alpha [Cyanobacteria bacterium HKST-UBA06]|nr:phenylalanine--tRNA ligase subunit alpha [Cyanobacteria bacterium HKST-UBA04]MCA9806940.1 phenylalanine--tRNA ligase subunit alpha [Cyanobacteria bacterium HKST-UBA06]
MEAQLQQLKAEAEAALKDTDAVDLATLDELRIRFLGRKEGRLTHIKRGLKDIPDSERPRIGSLANEVSEAIEGLITQKQQHLKEAALNDRLKTEAIDVTMPGAFRPQGQVHPITLVVEEVSNIFYGMGFERIDDDVCPEVETDYYNFDALNFPADHPARDMQDTFYTNVGKNVLLRSQTSTAQIRYMEKHQPPLRVVCPGRVYRNEDVSSKKGVLFHQFEGLLVDEHVTFADLKGTIHEFIRLFFGEERPTRFRASYFPFTEPSAEVDVAWQPAGKSEPVWLEIMGCGMVDPNVLRMVGIDPERYTGYAWGMGFERLAMLKYGIDDIRQFTTNDVRFLQQFLGA